MPRIKTKFGAQIMYFLLKFHFVYIVSLSKALVDVLSSACEKEEIK